MRGGLTSVALRARPRDGPKASICDALPPATNGVAHAGCTGLRARAHPGVSSYGAAALVPAPAWEAPHAAKAPGACGSVRSPCGPLPAAAAAAAASATRSLPLARPCTERLPPPAPRRELAQYEAQESAASQQSEAEEAVVGGYRVIRTLGRGAFGRVLLGQRDDGELAAIKMLPRGDRVRACAQLPARPRAPGSIARVQPQGPRRVRRAASPLGWPAASDR